MSDFLKICNLKNLVKQKTCHKNPEKPSCIDLILTNYQRSFQNTCVFQTGHSNFYKMSLLRNFTSLSNSLKSYVIEIFKNAIMIYIELNLKMNCWNIIYLTLSTKIFKCFFGDLKWTRLAKKKQVGANQSSFMALNPRKVVMKITN